MHTVFRTSDLAVPSISIPCFSLKLLISDSWLSVATLLKSKISKHLQWFSFFTSNTQRCCDKQKASVAYAIWSQCSLHNL